MAERRVVKWGNPLLTRGAEPVTQFGTEQLQLLVTDLWDTMSARGGTGLAAPQIGESYRIVVFEIKPSPRYPELDPVPPTVLINPEVQPVSENMAKGWEGCLSLPGMRGLVPRYACIEISAHDIHGQPIKQQVHGYHARVVQHECDHLDGILYPQRIQDMNMFGFEEELSLAGTLNQVSPC